MSEAETIRQIFCRTRTIAVVGLSPRPDRDSHIVARAMQALGYRIVPVNPRAGVAEILGEPVHATLTEAARQQPIDLVDCFRRSNEILPLVDEAIAIGASAVWLQLGVVHADAARRAEAAGLLVVQDRCLKIEHTALFASPPTVMAGF